jgi:hypothetical protein
VERVGVYFTGNIESMAKWNEFHRTKGWSCLKEVLPRTNRTSVFRILGIDRFAYSFLTNDQRVFARIMESIDDGMSFDRGRLVAQDTIIELIQNHIEGGGSTEEMDIDSFTDTRAIVLIPVILEHRKNEVEEAEIYYTTSSKKRINVSRLKKTYYGSKLLRELGFTKFTRRISTKDFARLKKRMKELELTLQAPKIKTNHG